MFGIEINPIGVLVAAIANVIVGMIWYGPVFGKKWMKLVGKSESDMEKDKKEMPKIFAISFIGSLIMAFVLTVINKGINTEYGQPENIFFGAYIGILVWLGFVATVNLSDLLYEKRNQQLVSLQSGYYLVSLVLQGAIISFF